MKIMFTHHARDVLAERRIPVEWVERTLLHPEYSEPDPDDPEARRAFRVIPENGDRVLRVVYVADGDDRRVITVFFDRSRRR